MRYHPLCGQQSAAAHVDGTHKEVGVCHNTQLFPDCYPVHSSLVFTPAVCDKNPYLL